MKLKENTCRFVQQVRSLILAIVFHIHPHWEITENNQWRNSNKKFFIPVKVAAKKFRGKFLHHSTNL
ncbi:transposase [Methylomusa anaerophila]|uniref:transposase n=1 Tax=Methylomusa anaerophila TaxID=1930071 RepID=UPI003A520FE5